MLPYRDTYLANNKAEGIAVCGVYCQNDSIHVGLYWNYGGEKMVIHFLNGNNIPVQPVEAPDFAAYLFNTITNFPEFLLPSISAFAELISQNKINGFQFNRAGGMYDGGKFTFSDGAYTGKTWPEKFVNCGVFVIALLNTYDFQLIDWDSWPNVDPLHLDFLSTWLRYYNIPVAEWPLYYNKTRAIRGKHILVSPSTQTHPSRYTETHQLAEELLSQLNP
ncbi:hypothetical protein [Chitinophaga silvisoli]|uniref:Uncharacterized protein n=1 Tax=Chitinophaga silvisoli TaxID=2291814 RepID=A0A3E1P776_9BACT|nr:hypothetical protein [Chitinophaga silvisoli]RFM36036.1 hypothetical protein DXN04_00535 [Chitinophaga silvisoli]